MELLDTSTDQKSSSHFPAAGLRQKYTVVVEKDIAVLVQIVHS